MFDIEFQVGATSRHVSMSFLPNIGDIVQLEASVDIDGSERLTLKVKSMIHRQESNGWSQYCHTDIMKNWLEKSQY